MTCTPSRHAQFKQSAEAFLRNTTDWMEIQTNRMVVCQGRCIRCGQLISYDVRTSPARNEAAREALKGE